MVIQPSDAFGSMLPEVTTRPPGYASRALAERLRRVESRDITYVSDAGPVFWEEARGANVRDVDRNVYLDLTAAFGVALLGHAHPGVVRAVREQAARLVHGMGDVHPPAAKVELLERLIGHAPWHDARAVLATTGSEAVEIALKTAQVATGRAGVVAFDGAYHGLTLGALAATSRDHFRAPFARRLYGGVAFAPFPDAARASGDPVDESLDAVDASLRNGAPNGDRIGAIIVEPVQGRAGTRLAPPGFMEALSDLAQEAGVLVIADEVLTGVGRCGAFLASEPVGLRPDLVCLGKALGGGVPISACVARADVMDAWPASRGEAIHTSTFLGHPLACAAALAVLDAIRDEGVIGCSRTLGVRMVDALRKELSDVPAVTEVRGLGLLAGVELDRGSIGAGPPGPAVRVAEASLTDGIIVLPAGEEGHVVQLTPPVCLSEQQTSHAVAALAGAVREAA